MSNVGSEVPLSRLELIVLARLSSARPPAPQELGEAVKAFVLPAESLPRAREVAIEVLGRLHARGLVADQPSPKRAPAAAPASKPGRSSRARPPAPPRPGRTLSDAGRRALCAALNVGGAPSWTQIRDAHVPALALGIRPGSREAQAALKDARTIATAVLRTEYGVTQASTPAALADALITEQLGLPAGKVTLDLIRVHFLAKRAGVDARGKLEQVAPRLAMKALQARGAGKKAMAPALTRRWFSAPADALEIQPVPSSVSAPPASPVTHAAPSPLTIQAPSQAQPHSADSLLGMVRDAIPTIGADGRFGPEKVFIAAIWHQLERHGRVVDFSLDRFKRWLLAANRDRLLDLARADLVGAMDSRLVAESEIEDLGSTFHFVLDRRVVAMGSERRSHAR